MADQIPYIGMSTYCPYNGTGSQTLMISASNQKVSYLAYIHMLPENNGTDF